jgi:N-acyl-D-aspartate/D-glutamate deacylase
MTSDFDLVIRGALVVDGSGEDPFGADVGVRAGRVSAIGSVEGVGDREIDADGAILTPGFVDPHTHYDAQLFWDGAATPSSCHGVTTVIGGNCGFTLAPVHAWDAEYTRNMMSRVEGMSVEALRRGLPWSWDNFGQYLDALEGKIAVNAGFLVGHCALRRYVMGDEANTRAAATHEIAMMERLLEDSLRAGGLGFSTSRSTTHTDGDENPVPSRLASEDEVLSLCKIVGQREGTFLEAIVQGCVTGFQDDEVELLANMSAIAGRPLNWNLLSVLEENKMSIEGQLGPSRRARELGGRVVALTMPVLADITMSFETFCGLFHLPGWAQVLRLPSEEKARRLRDRSVRADLLAAASTSRFSYHADFANYRVGETYSAANEGLESRRVGDIAGEWGVDPFECIVEIVARDDFKTVLWPSRGDSDGTWARRRALWDEADVMLGGSDAGAHLDRTLGSVYPTAFLYDTLRGRRLVSLERAVQMMTDVPASLFGLRHRGRVEVGNFADLVVLDPATVGSGPARRLHDLPGGGVRLHAESTGVLHVFVNGVESVVDGNSTGANAGTVLRSNRDTETVKTR